jgi:hypothetical protein
MKENYFKVKEQQLLINFLVEKVYMKKELMNLPKTRIHLEIKQNNY